MGESLTITVNSFTNMDQHERSLPAVAVRERKFRPLWELIRLQGILNSVRSRAEKKIKLNACVLLLHDKNDLYV